MGGAFHAPYGKECDVPDYRRWYVPGGTYFFTVVTYHRHPFFRNPVARRLLGNVMRDVRKEMPFETVAIALLWDHLHCIWTLPPGDAEYSERWKQIKTGFTMRWLEMGGIELPVSESRKKRGERGIWQRRFWEHTALAEADVEVRFDYTHYNPVRHRYVGRPWDWPWSSFRRYVDLGDYPKDWGSSEPPNLRGLDFE